MSSEQLSHSNDMYAFKIPKKQLSDLWRLREFCARGPIARQIREAIDGYLKTEEERIGAPIEDIADAIQRHEGERATNRGLQEY